MDTNGPDGTPEPGPASNPSMIGLGFPGEPGLPTILRGFAELHARGRSALWKVPELGVLVPARGDWLAGASTDGSRTVPYSEPPAAEPHHGAIAPTVWRPQTAD